ncbi:unnamed protein product [Cylicostephanus goldi]|uniref:Uncharacterized protein n=1 Tax=Cylicostephanus goldi TaxID=71465 RepID=A0A3P7NTT0_CYLGO|nr:unnamed protein product [Cylicostephanus goldi]
MARFNVVQSFLRLYHCLLNRTILNMLYQEG